MACCDSDSVAYSYFKACPKWQDRYEAILKAKLVTKLQRQGIIGDRNNDGKIDEEDLKDTERNGLMEEPFSDDVDVMMDLNHHIDNVIIVGGVDFNKSGSKRSASKINQGPQSMLEAVCMDWLISNTQCIGSE
jgi:hypothetical protein